MPSNLLYMDTNFPAFTGDESPNEKITTIQNYLYMLVEQLRYSMHNLDPGQNMNKTAVEKFASSITEPVYLRLEGDEEKLAKLALTVDGFSMEVSNGSTSSRVYLTSNGIMMSSAVISFSGYVTFNSLAAEGATVINGGNISTGTIKAITMEGNEIIGGTISAATLRSVSGSDNGLELYYGAVSQELKVGGIRFDDGGAGTDTEAKHRMYIYTEHGYADWAMKLKAAGGMSLESDANIYIKAATTMDLRAGQNLKIFTPTIYGAGGREWQFLEDGIYCDGTQVVAL